jgi:hypothetical protein
MSDKVSPPTGGAGSGTIHDPGLQGGQRKPPLSVLTTRPEWTDHNQSPTSSFALPPRGPLPPPASPYPAPLRSATTPASAGHKALHFARNERRESKSTRAGDPRRKSGSDIPTTKRRASGEGKNNTYTECGRHSDQWLLGGWSDAVKKMLWERDRKDNT